MHIININTCNVCKCVIIIIIIIITRQSVSCNARRHPVFEHQNTYGVILCYTVILAF